MTSWNYRVVKRKHNIPESLRLSRGEDFDYVWGIYEVYYNEGGRIESWTERSVEPIGNDKEDLLGTIILMLGAFIKPVLYMDDSGDHLTEKEQI